MALGLDGINLLKSLKQLYFKIMARLAKVRDKSSRKHSNAARPPNILSSLSECIDKLLANAAYTANNPVDASSSQTSELDNHSHNHAPSSREASSNDELGELSTHLRDSHKYSGASLGTGEKLMQSTWEHFHSSIRLARQGDVKAARLHAELTKNALIEAAHYLPEPVYSHFSKEVLKALEGIKGQI